MSAGADAGFCNRSSAHRRTPGTAAPRLSNRTGLGRRVHTTPDGTAPMKTPPPCPAIAHGTWPPPSGPRARRLFHPYPLAAPARHPAGPNPPKPQEDRNDDA